MSKASRPAAIREFRPSAKLVRQAREQMARYTFLIEPDGDGGFVGSVAELPGTVADGDAFEECAHNLTMTVETVVASYFADGQSPPEPFGREKRTEQVNVRFTWSERRLLEQESVRQGFRGIGDLIRAEVIRQFGPTKV